MEQAAMRKDTPLGTETGKKDIVASAKSGGSEGPMSRLDVSKRIVERKLANLEDTKNAVAVIKADEAKAHKLPSAVHEVAMAFAELAGCVQDIAALLDAKKEPELVRMALDSIVNSDVEGKQNANTLALLSAKLLLAQINMPQVQCSRDILDSDPITMHEAKQTIGLLVGDARGILAAGELKAGKRQELGQTVAVLGASAMEIYMLAREGKEIDLVKEALGLLIEHGSDERKILGAKAMLAEIPG